MFLTTVTDTSWEIGGAGDFDRDGKTDILWRNYGTGPYQGVNVVWLMNGNAILNEAFVTTVTDTNWRVAWIGDFNGDQQTDLLWRYYGTGPYQGANVVWFMNGTAILSEVFLTWVTDTNWRISGTGDFNGDQQTDILWRYYGTGPYQGANVVWLMNGTCDLERSVPDHGNGHSLGDWRNRGLQRGPEDGHPLAVLWDERSLPGGECHLVYG